MNTITLTPSGDFSVEVVSAAGTHSVTIPCNERGMIVLRHLLQAQAQRTATTRISEPAAPTQAVIDAWYKANPPKPRVVHGISLDTLELKI